MIVKRSITIRGHRTSISMEEAFWARLQAIAEARAQPLAGLVAGIDMSRAEATNLSSAIRLFVLDEALSQSRVAADAEAGRVGNDLPPDLD